MTDTVIIGAGLCGLALAEALERQGHDYALLDARDRVGGRILSEAHGDSAVDLGPAWFWPGQPRMEALVRRLGLRQFDQFASGAMVFQDQSGAVQHGHGFGSMEGSCRLEGGLACLTEALRARLSPDRVRTSTVVRGLTDGGEGVAVSLDGAPTVHARRAVLAMPPRLAAGLHYQPMLPNAILSMMGTVPTWMAGQAKAVAIYPKPFWRDAGLSGDAISRRGPMVEVHDASPTDAGFGALFGFIGVPPSGRVDKEELRRAVLAQFSALFGGAAPSSLRIKDWAMDPFTATSADAEPLMAHPAYGLPDSVQRLWQGRMLLSGTETAQQFGGYLEGALEAAEAVLAQLSGG